MCRLARAGYGGRKNLPALQAKLARLRKEAKGFATEKEVFCQRKKAFSIPRARGRNTSSFGIAATLSKSTLDVDGETIVKDGKLLQK